MTRSSVIKEALEDLPLIISLHDIENTILWANKAYREATGHMLEKIVDKKCHAKKCSEPELPMGNGETVLIVEDDAPILKLAKIILVRLGYTVLTAATPARALELAQAHGGNIDLLLTDVVMPMMNGRDLANQLRSLYPDLKILFMSGYTANVIAHRGALEPGVSFLQKPFGNRELANKVRESLSPN